MSLRTVDRSLVIIEDSDEDFEVTVWALRQAGVANPIRRCAKVAEINEFCTERIHGPGGLTARYPLLVLLDLNIPGLNWRNLLTKLQDDPWWRAVPVIILSTSQHPATVLECYHRGAAGYMKKSIDLDTFAKTIERFAGYWLEAVIPPPFGDEGLGAGIDPSGWLDR